MKKALRTLTENELKETLGADSIELVDTKRENARLQDLVSGKEKPRNETAAYIIERIREAKADFDNTQRNIQQLKQALSDANRMLIALDSKLEAYTKDLLHWD